MKPVDQPLYSGKAKSLWRTDRPGELIVRFRDDITAFDGGKHDVLEGKGIWNARVSAFFFQYLARHGVSTHYIGMDDERTMRVRELKMIPLEVIVRNIAAGSMVRNFPVEEGTSLDPPVIVIDFKDDSHHDPMLNNDLIIALHILSPGELSCVRETARTVNALLRRYLNTRGIELVDFKIEFGRAGEEIVLGDEISMDSMRLWDARSRQSLDKDVYRFDRGDVITVYREVAGRILAREGET